MLRAGWDAHNLNAPGQFLVSAPGHDTPKRARAYLLTDQVVTETAARYATSRPAWTPNHSAPFAPRTTSPTARPTVQPEISKDRRRANSAGDRSGPSGADEALWLALCLAPDEGTDVGELLRLTGMSRPTLYRRLAEHAKRAARSRSAGAAGARHHRGAATVSDRLTVRLISTPRARVCT